MPRTRSAKCDLADHLCEAIRRFGNAVCDWHNFHERKPEAPQEAERARKEIWDVWSRLKTSVAGKPGVTVGYVLGLQEHIAGALNWGRRFLPLIGSIRDEESGEEWPVEWARGDAETEPVLAAIDAFHPIPGVDAADLGDLLKFGAHLHSLEAHLRNLQEILDYNDELGRNAAERRSKPTPWRPPEGYVGTKEICHDVRFRKSGKNPQPSTIQRWVERAARENEPIEIVKAPDTGENFYPEAWIVRQIERWRPRSTPSRVPAE